MRVSNPRDAQDSNQSRFDFSRRTELDSVECRPAVIRSRFPWPAIHLRDSRELPPERRFSRSFQSCSVRVGSFAIAPRKTDSPDAAHLAVHDFVGSLASQQFMLSFTDSHDSS
jgi:hypothetical protein